MRTNMDLDHLTGPVIEILRSCHYPKSVKYLVRRLEMQGLIPSADKHRYSIALSHWLNGQEGIIGYHKNSNPILSYILADHAMKYCPEILEGEEE